jgi:hypothetical protein
MAANPFAQFAEQPVEVNPFAQFAEQPLPVVQSEIPAARQAPGIMTQLGRGAASLADVTLGGIIPGAVQMAAYPLARVGRSPEQAQAATQRLVSEVDQPFGKAFGVTQTPEYQQEPTRQLMNFIGENFQKGAKWISEKTGIAQPDVESIITSGAIAAPKVLPPVAREVTRAGKEAAGNVALAAKMPFEKQILAQREAASLKDYARGPQIDVAKEAQRLGIALNPLDIEKSIGTRVTSTLAGPRGPEALSNVNKNQVRNVALKEMDLPLTTQLNSKVAFDKARAQVAKPYEEVKNLPIQQADDAMIQRLESIRSDLDVIGAKEYAPSINKIVDDAIEKTQTGLTGEKLLKSISVLRERARKTYNNKAATTEALDIADTNLKVATELESMIDNSIFNPKLLQQYRDARQKMARIYTYEGATDINTGMIDVDKLARITSKNSNLTGDIASLGKIAGNYPESFSTKPSSSFFTTPRITRSSVGGALGALAGAPFGIPGAIIGTGLGAAAGEFAGAMAAQRMASPKYQAGLQVRDRRIPVTNELAAMSAIPRERGMVPYEAPVEVLMPGQGTQFPNFVMRPTNEGPITAPGVAANQLQLGMSREPMGGGQTNALRMEDARLRDLSMRQGAAMEAQAAAQAASRKPTSGEIMMEINPLTGLPEISKGLKGATPATFQDFGTSLKTAADKVTANRTFDMTAAEKIAWEKTKVDLAEVAPGFKSLTDKAIAERMMDRAWVEKTIDKIRQKEKGFADIAARATNERARQAALIEREKMQDLLQDLEESLRKPRAESGTGQGSKTREFIRNKLIADQNRNNLSR